MGLVVPSRFEILRQLGSGSVGEVFLARDVDGRRCAVKVVDAESSGERLREGTRAMSRVRHPALPEPFLFMDQGGVATCAMRALPGDEFMAVWSVLRGEEDGVEVATEFLRALAHLHAASIPHGDLSSNNILIAGGAGEPVSVSLLDVGTSADIGAISGTLEWLAPERLAGGAPSPRSDLFSVGMLLYSAIAGRPPYEGYPRHIPAIGTTVDFSAVGGRWARFLTALLPLDPDERPADGTEALEVLNAAFDRKAEPYSGVQLEELFSSAPFFDPDEHVESLISHVNRAFEGSGPRAARVGGGAGLGRSRILAELQLRLQLDGRRVVAERGLAGDAPFALVGRLFAVLDARERMPEDPEQGAAGENGDEDSALRRRVEQWRSALASTLGEQQTNLIVDDLDDADELSREVILTLLRQLSLAPASGPAAIVVSDEDFNEAGDVTIVTPGAWSELQTREALAATLPAATIAGEAGPLLHRRSGGRPQLLFALASAMARAGSLAVRLGELRCAAESSSPSPADALSLIGNRFESLPFPHRELLLRLALLRGPVRSQELSECWPEIARDKAREGLEQLSRRGWLRRSEGQNIIYALPGEDLRELLLRSWPDEPLREARGRVALWAEARLTGEHGPQDIAVAAQHLLAASPAGEPAEVHARGARLAVDTALLWLGQGAGRAAFELLSAVRVDALPLGGLVEKVLTLQGKSASLTGRLDEARSFLSRAVASASDPDGRRDAQFELAEVFRRAGRYGEALEVVGELRRSAVLGDSFSARLDAVEARVRFMQSDYSGAAAAAKRAWSADGESVALRQARAEGADVSGLVALYRGEFAEARACLKESCAIHAEDGRVSLVAEVESHVGLLHHRKAEFDTAALAYERALETAERSGDRGQQWRFAMNIAVVRHEQGRYEEALSRYEDALQQAAIIGDRAGLVRVSVNLANLCCSLGQFERTQELVARALPVARIEGDRIMESYAVTLLGQAALAQGALDDAGQYFDEALRSFEGLGCVGETCELRVHLGILGLERGEVEAARSFADEAVETASQHGFDEFLARGLVVAAEAERRGRGGDNTRARGYLDRALRLSETVAKPELDWWLAYHSFLLHRDDGDAVRAFREGRRAYAALLSQADRLSAERRRVFLAAYPQSVVFRQLAWLEHLDAGDPGRVQSVWQDLSLRRLLEVNKRLLQEHEQARLLEFIMDSAVLMAGAERGFLLMRRGEQEELAVVVARNLDRETVRRRRNKVSTSIAMQVVETGESVLSVDAMEEDRYRDYLSVHNLKLRSVLCVPLRWGDRVDGALYVDNRFQIGAFDEDNRAALEAFADQACLALRNARLVEELRTSREALLDSQARVEELNEELQRELEKTANELEASEEIVRRQRRALSAGNSFQNIVGASEPVQRMFGIMERVLDNDLSVVIEGESGTGKELVARGIHFEGSRSEREFVAVNCASIPATLIESELFGHVRGAFTGANRDRRGLFEAAHRGTLFLDEIGDMPLDMQVKLLRALQSGEFQKVGDTKSVRVDVRVLAATNRDLRQLVRDGLFREDLFYRLNVVQINVPPLRERVDDIPLLAQHFIEQNRTVGFTDVVRVRRDALRLLSTYSWPGNIRELSTVIKNAVLFAEGDALTPQDLANYPELASGAIGAREAGKRGAVRPLAEVEREAIVAALEHFRGNKKRSAEHLGIDRRTLYNKIASYGIQVKTSARVG